MKRSTLILFLYLTHKLYMELGVEILPNMDAIIEVQWTQDACLIKDDKNPIVIR